MPLRLLVVASETPDQQEQRRNRSGMASHETMADALRAARPDVEIEYGSCVDGTDPDAWAARHHDGVVFGGSPIAMHEETHETRSAARYMRGVFDSGTPSFGSCAGLQIAAVAAGGSVRPRDDGMRAAITRGVTRTEGGRGHPLLAGRPAAWDAPAMHSSMVIVPPPGAVALARTEGTPVEALEVRHGEGVHWGVQYHPEIDLTEIAEAIEASAPGLVEGGLAASRGRGRVLRRAPRGAGPRSGAARHRLATRHRSRSERSGAATPRDRQLPRSPRGRMSGGRKRDRR